MTLVDIDKNSDDRSSPMPNTHDVHPNPMAKQTISTSYTTTSNTAAQTRMRLVNNAIVAYDASNLITSYYGFIPSVSSVPVFIIAKPGFDVFADVLGIARPAGL